MLELGGILNEIIFSIVGFFASGQPVLAATLILVIMFQKHCQRHKKRQVSSHIYFYK